MKHRYIKKDRAYKPIQDTGRIKSSNDLHIDASINLVAAILYTTYNDYKSCLIYHHKHRDRYEKVKDKITEYNNYKSIEERYKYIKKHKKRLTEEDKKLINDFPSIPIIHKPQNSDYKFYWKYIENRQELDACKWFYKSDRFKAFTLGKADGEEVLKKGYEECFGK